MIDQERLNCLSDKFSKMDEEIVIEVNKDGIDVAYIDVWGDPTRQIIDLYYLGTESLECDRVYCKECSGLTEIWRGWVNVIVDFDKNEIHLCPDLSKPNEWFYYDEGFVKCYDVNPFTGEKEG